jgi:proline iminopeptidase
MAHDLDVFSELADDWHDVVLYDEIGTGHSARLEDPREYTLERDLADLEALLEA